MSKIGQQGTQDAAPSPPVARPRRLLFLCSRNQLRSPTAEAICQGIEGIEATSAGTNNDAEQPLTGDLIEWADVIFAMERTHQKRLTARFARQLAGKEVRVLGIPDDYAYMQPELVSLLKRRLQRWVDFERCGRSL